MAAPRTDRSREIGIHTPSGEARRIRIERATRGRNEELAAENRRRFAARSTLAVNLLSGPGAGTTTLLARTTAALAGRLRSGVIVGDPTTPYDAARLRRAGATAVQLTTGSAGHLDAAMIGSAYDALPDAALDLLFVENAGDLMGQAAWSLGEAVRVVLLPISEGEDKPLDHPAAFRSADLVLLTKFDLAPAVRFDHRTALAVLGEVAPGAPVIATSTEGGSGLDAWISFLERRLGVHRAALERAEHDAPGGAPRT